MRFYHSQAWRRMSQRIMARDHYECQECRKKRAKIRPATQVHHIIPYEVRPDLGLDEDNLEAICDGCHNAAHGRTWEQNQRQRKKYATEERW